MTQATKILSASMLGTLVSAALFSIAGTAGSLQPKPLQIGIAKTFLVDQPKSVVEIVTDEFKDVLKKASQLDGELVSTFGPADVAAKLDAKQFDFALFHAHEFAAAQKKYPQLQPLLVAADKYGIERVNLIVHQSNPAKSIADLRGKKIDIPTGTSEPCRAFLEKYCEPGPAAFFAAIEKSASRNDALDNVARQKVQATVVSTAALAFYKEVRGPVFEKNLRVLQQSEEFPPALIAVKQGAVDSAIVNQFRDGLLKVHTIPDGRDMMKSWNIESFALIPKDYDKKLADVLKAYPPR